MEQSRKHRRYSKANRISCFSIDRNSFCYLSLALYYVLFPPLLLQLILILESPIESYENKSSKCKILNIISNKRASQMKQNRTMTPQYYKTNILLAEREARMMNIERGFINNNCSNWV